MSSSPDKGGKTGKIFVMTGPSGVGKGTLCKGLLDSEPDLVLSVSATSRGKRQGEEDGRHYYFRTSDEFRRMIDAGELLEWAEYNGNYYGTPKAPVMEQLKAGNSVLLEIEVQGALMVKEQFPEACLIFIAPPDMDALEQRLRGRGTDSDENISNRLAISRHEMTLRDRFDYVVTNDHLEICQQALKNILRELRQA